jgi:hypothetical protein
MIVTDIFIFRGDRTWNCLSSYNGVVIATAPADCQPVEESPLGYIDSAMDSDLRLTDFRSAVAGQLRSFMGSRLAEYARFSSSEL